MTSFEEDVGTTDARYIRSDRRRAQPDPEQAESEVEYLARMVATRSPVGLAVLKDGDWWWANQAFQAHIRNHVGAVADRAAGLRSDRPTPLAVLLDDESVTTRFDVWLLAQIVDDFTIVASVIGGSDRGSRSPASSDDSADGSSRAEVESPLQGLGDPSIHTILVTIDHLDELDHSHGPGSADEVSAEVARRLVAVTRTSDVVHGMGRGGFVILGRDLGAAGSGSGNPVTRRFARAVTSQPVLLEDDEVFVTISTSVGLAEPYPERRGAGAGPRTEIDACADPDGERAAIGLALEAQRFRLLYQPIVALDSGRTVGYEALLRLILHDDRTLTPSEFLPQVEASGYDDLVGEWVIDEALRSLVSRRSDRAGMCINVSPGQFASGTLPGTFDDLLSRFDVDPERLVVQVTESALLDDPDRLKGQLRELSAMNIGVALDEFGCGHSSLTQLSDLPVDILKLDRRFVEDIDTDEAKSVTRMVVAVADSLRCDIGAEGIDTDEQRTELLALGCGYGQGSYFGRPAPLPRVTDGS